MGDPYEDKIGNHRLLNGVCVDCGCDGENHLTCDEHGAAPGAALKPEV